MPKDDVNRNLLFGLLALQNGFIDQSALVTAFHGWARDKNRALADYLIDRGDLDTQHKSAIESLVALYQEDDGKSLERGVVATLDRHGQVRAELERSLDLDAKLAFTLLSGRLETAGEHSLDETVEVAVDATRTYRSEPPTPSSQRFRILRFHAEGGLGAVYLAHDEELNREVALKRIKGRAAHDPDCRLRFVREAEITGRLEHPGIVPVYGLGQLEDGRPEYAMRFIEGESLKTAINRLHKTGVSLSAEFGARSPRLANLLRRFLGVCDAISYAHDRGVVHRDIKPSNIMLGSYGETLVVDWGLAKPIGSTDEPLDGVERILQTSSRDSGGSPTIGLVGTPRYMSPEQAAAEHDQVGFASDIYSLGATLYCLLTGKAPIEGDGDRAEVLIAKVRLGQFRKPRQRNPDVPKALEAICLKAMSLRPEDRYPTARALGEDIERWLADAPVSVYSEPPTVRFGRWVRRNKPLVAAGVALAICSIIALIVDVVRVGRERAVAEDNFLIAREAVNRVLTEVAEGPLAAVPQAEELRLRVAKDALAFNERFLRQSPRDADVVREAASTYRKVANIQRMLNLNRDAASSYALAVELGEQILGEFKGNLRDQLNLALTFADQGELQRLNGDLEGAERSCRRTIMIAERLLGQFPNDSNCHLARGTGMLYLGQVQLDQKQPEGAFLSTQEAVTEFRGLMRSSFDGPRNAVLLCLALNDFGKASSQSGHAENAEPRLEESITLATSVLSFLADKPTMVGKSTAWLIPNLRYARSRAELELAMLIAADQERRALAMGHFDSAIKELSSLTQAFPRVANYSSLLKFATFRREEFRVVLDSKH